MGAYSLPHKVQRYAYADIVHAYRWTLVSPLRLLWVDIIPIFSPAFSNTHYPQTLEKGSLMPVFKIDYCKSIDCWWDGWYCRAIHRAAFYLDATPNAILLDKLALDRATGRAK